MKNAVRNNAGFSLIELMVVVAIIGILAAIAVPNFQRFQAKSRQSEAKTNLGSLFACEKAFFAEWNNYFNDFRDIGLSPEGQLHYRMGWAAASPALAGIGYSGPSAPAGVAVAAAQFVTTTYCAGAPGAPCAETAFVGALPAGTAISAVGTVNPTFKAGSGGTISSTGVEDTWTIDDKKNLLNVASGI